MWQYLPVQENKIVCKYGRLPCKREQEKVAEEITIGYSMVEIS